MKIKEKLRLMREIERRNEARIEAYRKARKALFQTLKRNPKGNREKKR